MREPDDPLNRTTLNIPELRGEHMEGTDARNTPDSVETMDSDETLVEVEDLPHRAVTRRLPRLRFPGQRVRLLVPVSWRRSWVRWAWLGVLLGLVAVLVIVVLQTRAQQIQFAHVSTGDLTLSFPATGHLQSATYDANFSGSGKVAEIDVTVGQQVDEGTTLAKLDSTQLQDALNEAQAAVSSAQTQVDDAQAAQQRVQAKTAADVAAAFDQEQNAIAQCGSNDSACVQRAQDVYAAAQAEADSENADAQSAADAAQSTLSAAQAKAQTAQDNLNGATLTAPHSGTIAAINSAVGSTVVGSNATAPVTSFITIADLGSLQIAASVGIANVAAVAQDNTVHFTVPSLGSQVFQGKVDGVSPVASGGAALRYPLTIDVDMQSAQNSHLFPGMTANITITTQQRFGVLLIPASAVKFAKAAAEPKLGGFITSKQVTTALSESRQMLLDTQSAGADVSNDNPTPGYVLERTGTGSGTGWVVKPVVLGLTDGVSYEILNGLSVGDKVVTGEVNGPVTVPTPTPTPAGS